MFVKAGIVAAVAAASLVAVSPLAFAGDYGDHGHKSHHKSHHDGDNDDNDGHHRGHYRHAGAKDSDNCNGDVNQVNSGDSRGLVNVSGVNAAVPVNVCNNDIVSGVLGILSKDLTNNDNH